MEQGKINTEEKSSAVEEVKETGGYVIKKSVDRFSDEEMPSEPSTDEDNFKSNLSEFSFATNSNSNRVIAKRKFDEKEMSLLIVPEAECALKTNEHVPNIQEAKRNSIELSRKKYIQESSRTVRHHQTSKEPAALMLSGLKTDKAVVKCLQNLVDQVVYELEIGVDSLPSLQLFKPPNTSSYKTRLLQNKDQLQTLSHQIVVQPNTKILDGSSSQDRFKFNHMKESVDKTEISKALIKPLLNRSQSKKVRKEIAKCLQKLVDRVVYNLEFESLASLRTFQPPSTSPKKTGKSQNKSQLPTLSHRIVVQPKLKNLDGSSSENRFKIQPLKKADEKPVSKESLLKYQRQVRKDFDILSTILDEIERMNDFYRIDIIDKNEQVIEVHNCVMHVSECLILIQDLPTCTITFNDESDSFGQVDVYKYGSQLFQDLTFLTKRMDTFIQKYNGFRLQFHSLSENFSIIPLENFIGRRGKYDVQIHSAIETSKNIYKKYFGDERFDFIFESLDTELKKLQRCVKKFDDFLDILGDQRDRYGVEYW